MDRGRGDWPVGSPCPTSCSTSVCASSSRKKGLPCALARSASASGGGTVSLLEHRLDDLHTVLGRERRHGELGGVGLLQPRRPIPRAVGAQDQDGRAGEALHQRGEKLLGGGVNPVQVFHRENERVLLTALAARAAAASQRCAPSASPGCSPPPARWPPPRPADAAEQGAPVSGASPTAWSRPHTFAVMAASPSAGVMPQCARSQSQHGQIGRGAAIGETAAFQVRHPVRVQLLAPLREEPRLADAGLPHDPHHLPPAPTTCARAACSVASSCARPTKGLRARSSPVGSRDVLRVRSPTTW